MQNRTDHETAIERRHGLAYKEFIEKYLKPHKPVIISDALVHWKAVGKWTPQYLAERYGDREFMVDGRMWKIRDLVPLVLASNEFQPAPYLRNQRVEDLSPELLADISPLPEYLRPNWLETRFYPMKIRQILGRAIYPDFFIGGAGRSFPVLHFDAINSHAFLSQLSGEKQYLAYSPDQTQWLYPNPKRLNHSLVNVENPDLDQYPFFKRATPLTGKLGPGEMLFIPAGWWHTAKILSPAVTISINTANSSNWFGLIKDQYREARHSEHFTYRLAAAPLAAYLGGVGLYKRLGL
jgi:histone arginine demethylase JMJD6